MSILAIIVNSKIGCAIAGNINTRVISNATKERKGIMTAAIIAAGCHGVFQFAAFAFTMSLRSSRIRSPRVRRVKVGFVALRLRYHDKCSAITITAIAALSAVETADFYYRSSSSRRAFLPRAKPAQTSIQWS